MRKLRIFENISLDGVIQHSADDNGFAYSDWTGPYRTPEGRDLLTAMYGDKYDMLLGRRTYDMWSNHWPKVPSGPLADGINAATKYVVTHNAESLEWGPFEAVGPDVIEGIRRIKATNGPDLHVAGSSTLPSLLMDEGLADELVLTVYPVLLGAGKRLFADGIPAQKFELVSSQATPTGVLLNRYKIGGPIKTA
jgi:dihydrofolate reductase